MGGGLVAYDLLYINLAAALYGGAAWAGVQAYRAMVAWIPWWLALFPAFVVGALALIAEVSILSLLCPRPKPGRYKMMRGAVFYGWLARALLRRILLLPGVRWVIFSSNVLRWLALRGMGAKVAFTSNMSTDVDILDPALLVVGPGATIGTRCTVSGHYVDKGRLILGEVRIGAKALLAADVLVGPDVTIGARAVVGARAAFGPSVKIGDDARIGGDTTIEAAASIGAHAVVATGVHLPPRAKVGDHARVTASTSAASTKSSAAPAV